MSQKGKQDFDGAIDGVGYKGSMDDPKKLPLTLIPPQLLTWLGGVLQYGASKYARGQWMRGMSFSEVMDAVKRHIAAWESGEDRDAESGQHHLAHAATGLAFMAWFIIGPRYPEYVRFDDRLFLPASRVPGSIFVSGAQPARMPGGAEG